MGLNGDPERPLRRAPAPSLRLRITAGALVVVVVAIGAAGYAVIDRVDGEMRSEIDRTLTADADFTTRLLASGSGLPMSEGPTDLYVQFVARDGRVLGAGTAATGLPALAPPEAVAAPPAVGLPAIVGTEDAILGPLRVLTAPVPGNDEITLVLARSSRSVAEVRASLIRLLLVLLLLGSATLGLLIWVVVGRALRPVERMRRRVDAIGAGDLGARLEPPATGDELDRLAATLNDLLARLEAAVERENRFVADASHELQTPIAAVRALLETEPATPAEVVGVRAEALARLSQLQALVEDLLALASAEQPAERPAGAVDLDDLVLTQARQLGRTTVLQIDTAKVSGGQVWGRDIDLGRLVENLTSNAARHASTRIELEVHDHGSVVELVVADDGPGIPPAERQQVFERFHTGGEDSPARSGTGLGLAIVAAIAGAHGGSVRAESRPAGGARFVVRLPGAGEAEGSFSDAAARAS